ncbi:sulfotransferase [Parafrankia elaeagni]|uniref:sulfotransferase n=1 Tax=Parafrankia elaeagni TaxID=222534 RepID=UPI0003621260|nr:sulfotransferase [Parafrankia elaeagni]
MDLIFIVGTGRCGSTLISRILSRHPDMLSVSEFCTLLRARFYLEGELDGPGYWRMLTDPDPVADAMVRDGLKASEHIYPYGSGRFDPASGVPVISHMTLPMLTDDPDALYDELAAEVPAWPLRPIADQHRRLFGWLAARFDRTIVVERSGGSLGEVAGLAAAFPESRFVYLTRDGADSALSMSRHPGFRLMLLGREAALAAGVETPERLGPEHAHLVPAGLLRGLVPPFDPGRVMNGDVPLTAFGALWSDMICAGAAALAQLPAQRWTTMSYEDLIRDPRAELGRFASFVGIAPDATRDDWINGAAALVDQSRPGASSRLDPRLLAALRRSCAPGATAHRELVDHP